MEPDGETLAEIERKTEKGGRDLGIRKRIEMVRLAK